MKELLNLWLSRHLDHPGVLAASIRYPDQAVFTQSWDPGFPVASVEAGWRGWEDALRAMQGQRFPGRSCCWTFERVRWHLVRRADGVCLSVVSARETQGAASEGVDRLLAEFVVLPG